MVLYSTRISSTSDLSSLLNCVSAHLKLAKNVALSSRLLGGLSFWMVSNSSISRKVQLRMEVWVDGTPGCLA